jgi:hypothetical protein
MKELDTTKIAKGTKFPTTGRVLNLKTLFFLRALRGLRGDTFPRVAQESRQPH